MAPVAPEILALRASVAELDAAIAAHPAGPERTALQDRRAALARDLRHAEIEAHRARAAPPPAVTSRDAAIEAEQREALALLPAGAESPAALAVARATAELELRGDQRRQRERAAYALYVDQRSAGEIIAALCDAYGVQESTARADLARVRAIAESWRAGADYLADRDQHVAGLAHMRDAAMADGDIETARKIMADIAAIKGYKAPARGVVMHGHVHTTLPSGPGMIAGIDVRELPRAQRDALLLLLPSEAREAGIQDAEIVDSEDEDPASSDEHAV